MNDGTSLRNVRQIRRMEYPKYNLGNTRTSQISVLVWLCCLGVLCLKCPFINITRMNTRVEI